MSAAPTAGVLSKAEMAAHGMAAFDLDPAATVLVGDSADDAAAAQACGLRFAAVTYRYGRVHACTACPIHCRLGGLGDRLQAIVPPRPE